jgi:hypothetical protein
MLFAASLIAVYSNLIGVGFGCQYLNSYELVMTFVPDFGSKKRLSQLQFDDLFFDSAECSTEKLFRPSKLDYAFAHGHVDYL